MEAHNAILEHRVDQMFHVNGKRHESKIYAVDDHIYLSTQNLTLPKGRARKLILRYIGQYRVTEADNKGLHMVMLELPEDLKNQRVANLPHQPRQTVHH
jgi:hypothetical protein